MAWQENPKKKKNSFQANKYYFTTLTKALPWKVKIKMVRTFKLINVYPYGAVDLKDERNGQEFKVNSQRA